MSSAEDIEIWKPVHLEFYANDYSVSNLGRVRAERACKGYRSGRLVNTQIIRGYHTVYLCSKNKRKRASVHILVAYAFLGNPPGTHGQKSTDYQVDHKNGKLDNRASQLQWVTTKRNNELSVLRGDRARGERHHNTPFVVSDILRIRHLCEKGYHPEVIALEFKTTRQTISRIHKRVTWTHV